MDDASVEVSEDPRRGHDQFDPAAVRSVVHDVVNSSPTLVDLVGCLPDVKKWSTRTRRTFTVASGEQHRLVAFRDRFLDRRDAVSPPPVDSGSRVRVEIPLLGPRAGSEPEL